MGGMCTRQAAAHSGSGGTYVTGYLDSNWRPNMNEAEGIKFVLDGA
jgi:20S proteasome subunit beta 1